MMVTFSFSQLVIYSISFLGGGRGEEEREGIGKCLISGQTVCLSVQYHCISVDVWLFS